jgi:hypothetical protein
MFSQTRKLISIETYEGARKVIMVHVAALQVFCSFQSTQLVNLVCATCNTAPTSPVLSIHWVASAGLGKKPAMGSDPERILGH